MFFYALCVLCDSKWLTIDTWGPCACLNNIQVDGQTRVKKIKRFLGCRNEISAMFLR